MLPLSILGGAGASPSASSSATSGDARGGIQDTASGDFNFKSASGASSAGGLFTPVMVAGIVVVGLIAWAVIRRR